MKVFVTTQRLYLREILPEDENGLFELDADPEVHRYLGNQPVQSIEQVRKTIQFIRQQYTDNGIGRWAVIEKQTNNFIGWAGLKRVRERINNHIDYYDLGYRLIRKYWGYGYATETAKASLAYGFENLNLTEIYAMAECGNIGSNHVLTKAGLTFIEVFNYGGVNHNWYTITRADWQRITQLSTVLL